MHIVNAIEVDMVIIPLKEISGSMKTALSDAIKM
jgi:hypothetical protein